MSFTILALCFAALFFVGAAIMVVYNTEKDAKRFPVSYSIAWGFIVLFGASLLVAWWQYDVNANASQDAWNQLCWDRGGVLEYGTCMKPGFEEVQMPELR